MPLFRFGFRHQGKSKDKNPYQGRHHGAGSHTVVAAGTNGFIAQGIVDIKTNQSNPGKNIDYLLYSCRELELLGPSAVFKEYKNP